MNCDATNSQAQAAQCQHKVNAHVIRIGILGQPHWGAKLAGFINGTGQDLSAAFVAPKDIFSASGLRVLTRADLLLRIGFRPAAPTIRGRLFDSVWAVLRSINPQAKAVYYWIGTDVLNAVNDHRCNRLLTNRLEHAKKDFHLACAPWLTEELRDIGIDSRTVFFLPRLPQMQVPDSLSQPFSVLTYIPDGRFQFYGGECLYECARALPSVCFDVIGGEGSWAPAPLPNLKFHGWKNDIIPFLLKASVVMRLVRHDALGATVLQALAAARHVIYTYPLPFVHSVAFGDVNGTVDAIRALNKQACEGQLRPNWGGQEYVRANFDYDQALQMLLDILREIACD